MQLLMDLQITFQAINLKCAFYKCQYDGIKKLIIKKKKKNGFGS